MPVNDRQLAVLRAQLAGRLDEHKELLARLDWSVDGIGYAALMDAAFAEAVDRRFGAKPNAGDVAAYVAGQAVDADIAERLIGAVAGRGNIEDIDPRTAITTRQSLLVAMTADAGYDDAALEQFLLAASKLADQWLA